MYGDDRRKFVLGTLLLLLLGITLAAGLVYLKRPAHGVYGAIALSHNTFGFGTSWGYPDAPSAYDRAQKECARTGNADCAVRVALVGTCGSLVMTGERNQTFAVTATDKNYATALALAQCQATGASDCKVTANFCGGS